MIIIILTLKVLALIGALVAAVQYYTGNFERAVWTMLLVIAALVITGKAKEE